MLTLTKPTSMGSATEAAIGWNWKRFVGSPEALRYAKRELANVDKALSYVPERRVVVQAGGCLGIFPKYLAGFFEHIFTFEPDTENVACMRHNARETNIQVFQAALGDTIGTVGLSRKRRDGKPNQHAGIVHVSGPGDVPLITLDSLDLPTCDLVYLDVEGGELAALRGGLDLITRCRPVIAVEVNKNLQYVGITEAEVMRFFMEQHYQFVAQAGSDRIFVPSERT
jgi:FkbM family methyltransferase